MRVWCSVRDLRRWLAKRARDAGLWLADGATRPDEPGPWFIYAERHRRGLLLVAARSSLTSSWSMALRDQR